MKIKSLECDSFAGLVDKDIELESGLNILVGPNEAGKSTCMDLIYSMFFQNVKLHGTSDAAFIENYFPKRITGMSGNVIDGRLKLQTAEGTYVISKEWSKNKEDSTCSIKLPSGDRIKGDDETNKIIDKFFDYGQGILNEIVFPSQKRSNNAVECILKKLSGKKTDGLDNIKQELSSALNQATLETGGVSIDKLETELKNKLIAYGERWDFGADMPEGGAKRGIDNPWSCATGKDALNGEKAIILKNYYDMKTIAKEQVEVQLAERTVDNYKAKLIAAQDNKKQAQANKDKFTSYEAILGQSAHFKDSINERNLRLKELRDASAAWPNFVAGLKLMGELKLQRQHALTKHHYNICNTAKQLHEDKCKELASLKEVSPEDIRVAREKLALKIKLEGQLSGLNLVARIKQLSDTPINITSATTGDKLPLVDGELSINDAVEINIPGIMELQLTPQGVDIDSIKVQLAHISRNINEIYAKYGVDSVEKLEELSSMYKNVAQQVEQAAAQFTALLNGKAWEELVKEYEALPDSVLSVEEADGKVREVCGTKSIEEMTAYYSSMIAEYEKRYSDMEQLHKDIVLKEAEVNKYQSKLDAMDELPEEYAKLSDVDYYKEQLNSTIEMYEKECDSLTSQLNEAIRSLGDRTSEEFEEMLFQTQTKFDNAKATYFHWKNIYDKFVALRTSAMTTHTVSIEPQFKKYLDIISGGKLSVTEIDDKLNVELASGNNAMTYNILSAGTKKTIDLAFRLAMLEHIFPNGGGFVLLDDPFTDMDPDRRSHACKLVEEFAKNNQVIFVTCDDIYTTMMKGNVIRL